MVSVQFVSSGVPVGADRRLPRVESKGVRPSPTPRYGAAFALCARASNSVFNFWLLAKN